MNLNDIAKSYHDEDSARAFLESERWPKGDVACPKCGEIGRAYRLQPKEGSKSAVRKGVWKCGACRKQFTVTVGTIFEDSHIPLNKWLMAIHLLCSSKKGMSAHQLHRMLGVTYKSAWFMAHRIRYAMAHLNLSKLSGAVEIDETYVGGKERGRQGVKSNKAPVVALVERGGDVRSFHHREMVTGNLGGHLKTGQLGSLQKRPTVWPRTWSLFIPRSPDQASLFWFSSFAVRI
jgi:transposase-like protein